ncbi:MAG: hypothetical protein AAF360_10760, partial [Pseudomonadota bacterium]
FAARAWDGLIRSVSKGPNTLVVCHGGLWYAASKYTRVEPGLWPMPNALPIHVTPSANAWGAKVLGDRAA